MATEPSASNLARLMTSSTNSSERAVTAALREALVSLRSGGVPQESVHHYLSKVDEDFQLRLRQRFPSLTRKQERVVPQFEHPVR